MAFKINNRAFILKIIQIKNIDKVRILFEKSNLRYLT